MAKLLGLILVWCCFNAFPALAQQGKALNTKPKSVSQPIPKKIVMQKTEDDWKKELSPEQYRVLRQKGTERAFTGAYWDNHDKGVYKCAGCHTVLFTSDTKFDSGTGWPSFFDIAAKGTVKTVRDTSHGMIRDEVVCANCNGHLGHLFDDGPRPTGLRYCINSLSLEFEKK